MRKHYAQKAEKRLQPEHQAGGSVATQKLIAARCGVSQMTVSRVLRGDASISEETASGILTVAREMGYDPLAQDAARRLVLRRSGQKVANYLVAVVLPQEGLQQTYYTSMVQGVSANAHQCRLLRLAGESSHRWLIQLRNADLLPPRRCRRYAHPL